MGISINYLKIKKKKKKKKKFIIFFIKKKKFLLTFINILYQLNL